MIFILKMFASAKDMERGLQKEIRNGSLPPLGNSHDKTRMSHVVVLFPCARR